MIKRILLISKFKNLYFKELITDLRKFPHVFLCQISQLKFLNKTVPEFKMDIIMQGFPPELETLDETPKYIITSFSSLLNSVIYRFTCCFDNGFSGTITEDLRFDERSKTRVSSDRKERRALSNTGQFSKISSSKRQPVKHLVVLLEDVIFTSEMLDKLLLSKVITHNVLAKHHI